MQDDIRMQARQSLGESLEQDRAGRWNELRLDSCGDSWWWERTKGSPDGKSHSLHVCVYIQHFCLWDSWNLFIPLPQTHWCPSTKTFTYGIAEVSIFGNSTLLLPLGKVETWPFFKHRGGKSQGSAEDKKFCNLVSSPLSVTWLCDLW